MSSPQEIQRDIERTRASLSAGVDRLSEKVSPAKVVGRRVEQVKGTAVSVKDRVMGSAGEDTGLRGVGESMGSGMSSAQDTIGSAASAVHDTSTAAPQTIRRQTQGNPLAAGLVAFGVGWLLSSLAPATEREQDIAKLAADKASELTEPLKDTAQQIAANIQEPLQHSAEHIKAAATDAATQTAEQATATAADIKQPLQQ